MSIHAQIVADYLAQPDPAEPIAEVVKKLSPEQRKKLLQLYKPRVVEQYTPHVPHPKQQLFLSLRQREVGFGGAAGPGKSDGLLMAALQYVDVPHYSALILRRTWPDLNAPGAIMDRAREWLHDTDAHPREGGRYWDFPSGAVLAFGHLQYDKDKYKYASAEFQYIGFDEATQFEESTYSFLFSRLRRPALPCLNCRTPVRKYPSGWKHVNKIKCRGIFPDPRAIQQYTPAPDGTTLFDVPLRMRSATNPGGIGHEWYKARFIDPRTRRQGVVFVPGLLRDNPSIDQAEYVDSLSHLSPLDLARLLNGDWDVTEEGVMFQRHWFKPVDYVPEDAERVRYWDLAASDDRDSDWTVGALLALYEGEWYIEDIVRAQKTPYGVEKLVEHTAQIDGSRIPIRMEQEPGASGKATIDHYRRNVLVGYNFDGHRPTGDKVERARPLSTAAEAEHVFIKVAQWNLDFLNEVSIFPNGSHDDQVDAVSGGLHWLAFGPQTRIIV